MHIRRGPVVNARRFKALFAYALLLYSVDSRVRAQGTLWFDNRVTGPFIESPVYAPDGLTYAAAGSIYVQLSAGPTASSLDPVGVPVLLGPRDGYYEGTLVTVPSVAPGEIAWVRVMAWDVRADDFSDAIARGFLRGESNLFQAQTAGWTAPPTALLGLAAMTLQVPEPTVWMLIGCGALLMGVRNLTALPIVSTERALCQQRRQFHRQQQRLRSHPANSQFVHCASAIDGQNGGTVKVLTALFNDVGKVLDGLSSTTIQAQHCTINDADYFNYSPASSSVS